MKLKTLLLLLLLATLQKTKAQDIDRFTVLYDSVYKVLHSEDRSKADEIFKAIFKIKNIEKIDSLAFKLYEQYAFHFYLKGDYDKSAKNLLKATDFAKKIKNQELVLDSQNNLALIFTKLGEYQKAKKIYQEILSNYKENETGKGYTSTLSNLGSSYQALNQIDSSNYILNKVLKISVKKDYKNITAANLKVLSKNYLIQKKYNNVLNTVKNLKLKYWNDIDPKQKDDVMFYKAEANYHLGKHSQALSDLNEVFQYMKRMDKDPSIIERLQFKSKVLKALGKFDEALQTFEEASKIRDSIDTANISAKVLEIEEKYQAEKKEKENILLREETIKKDLEIAKQDFYLAFIFIALSSVIIFLVVYQLIKFRNKNKQLKASILKREKLEIELTQVRDNIAKDFHDSLGNKLARISALSDLMIQHQNKKSKQEFIHSLDYIKNDSDLLYKQTKDFMFSLKSGSDYIEEVVTYITDFAQDFTNSFKIDLIVNKSIDDNIKLPHYWNRNIILIAKEAITNAVKHSKAKEITTSFNLNSNYLKIDIIDDGIGFDEKNLKRINGLNNMKERASQMGATLNVNSNSRGTTITIEVNIKEKISEDE
ncbi:MAG: tetratricopeptide repeat protein [Flavobacteriaceae bacterium]|nr:tetratricopeptide repeat protein [Flavobacteriaceae bacterium]